jgi:hypothetical protein
MHAVIRTYSGPTARQLFDLLEGRKSEVEALLKSVPGLVSFTMARSGDGGVTCTVCEDKAGTEASTRVAREWVQKNAAAIGASPPSIAEGAVLLHIR